MPLRKPDAPPWYAKDGLRFRCTACGQCCTGEPGYVWVTPTDVKRLAKRLGLGVDAFSKQYVRRVGGRLSLRERPNGDCAMLVDKKCSVYDVKPSQCSTFPFWDEVVESKEAWDETAERCPGMNRGDVYQVAEIDVLVRGVPEPLLTKQAEAAARGDAPEPAAPASVVDEASWAGAFAALEEVYADLDAELPRYKFVCQASGDCCDFEAFGHRLYASTVEAEYFFRNSDPRRANEDPRACPAWGANRLCTARQGRMLGCRTFFCGEHKNGDPNEIYERHYRRVKEIHDRFGIPFRYADVVAWSAERRPARGEAPPPTSSGVA